MRRGVRIVKRQSTDPGHFRDLPSNAALCRSRGDTIRVSEEPESPMDKSPAGEASTPLPPAGRLDSWKDIATYLNRDVTTVQRWEKREGMPVHRHLHDKIGSVYAFPTELDAWARGRRPRESQGSGTSGPQLTPLRSERSTIWTFLNRPTFVLGLSVAGV